MYLLTIINVVENEEKEKDAEREREREITRLMQDSMSIR